VFQTMIKLSTVVDIYLDVSFVCSRVAKGNPPPPPQKHTTQTKSITDILHIVLSSLLVSTCLFLGS
jgi:hypothetical protein